MCDDIICGKKPNMPPLTVPESDRRAFLKGLIALPLAAVLAVPELRAAAAARTQEVTLTRTGSEAATGFMAEPENAADAPAIVLIHEWWGLNDQIKTVAQEFAQLGYRAFAIDLYGGEVATTSAGARKLIGQVDRSKARSQLETAVHVLAESGNGKVGTVGWCFGGAWSLGAAMAAPVDAAVIYYGRISHPPEGFAQIRGHVMGHFGTQDRGIPADMVQKLTDGMDTAGKADKLSLHWYDADHAFANPTGSRYDEADAALAWDRTTAFFARHLKD